MKGNEFLQVAEELADGRAEGHWRSATSRAYYAAFHVAREALSMNSIRIPANSTSHEMVIRCLNNADNEELGEAATELGTLRTNRLEADYKLDGAAFTENQARLDVHLAETVVNHIGRSPLKKGGAAAVIKAIRQYLQKTNQWLG